MSFRSFQIFQASRQRIDQQFNQGLIATVQVKVKNRYGSKLSVMIT